MGKVSPSERGLNYAINYALSLEAEFPLFSDEHDKHFNRIFLKVRETTILRHLSECSPQIPQSPIPRGYNP